MSNVIAQVVVGLPVEGPFDYLIPEGMRSNITRGMRVRILFNRQRRIGFVVGLAEKSSFDRLNPLIAILEDAPSVSASALELCKRLSAYYGCSLGEAIETYLPPSIRKGSFAKIIEPQSFVGEESAGMPILVYGFPDEKRENFIFEQIKKTLKRNKSVLFLVPEVSEIAPIVQQLQSFFQEPIAVFDKKVTAKKECELWLKVKQGEYRVVIGVRSVVFAPAAHLGLIVVFGEENDAYKQEQVPHYHVRDVVLMRSQIERCDVMFVSTAPSAEIWHKAKKEKWERVVFTHVHLNDMQVVDMTNYNPRRSSIISYPLQNDIQKFLNERKKIVLVMNRRGFFTLTQCNQCGYILKCERCDVNLTYMYAQKKMVCRHCNFECDLPKICPDCKGNYLRSRGTGIEKLESEVSRIFPQAKVALFDSDSKHAFIKADIMVATQAVLKERDVFAPDLIGMLNFDAELNRFDFRCANKAFSLLVHLRTWAKEKFVVQTRMFDNYALKNAKWLNYDRFYREELNFRKELKLPPVGNLIAIGVRGVIEKTTMECAQDLYQRLKENTLKIIEVEDMNPDVNPKLRDKFRYTILLKGSRHNSMLKFIKKTLKNFKKKRGVVLTVNVDP